MKNLNCDVCNKLALDIQGLCQPQFEFTNLRKGTKKLFYIALFERIPSIIKLEKGQNKVFELFY